MKIKRHKVIASLEPLAVLLFFYGIFMCSEKLEIMQKRYFGLIGIMMILLLQSFAPKASALVVDDEWKLLGITTVKGSLDEDEIKVPFGKGPFRFVKIKVSEAPLEMKKFTIHFRNGGKQEVFVRKTFLKNTESRPIDLKGDKRYIKKIVFQYSQKKKSGKKPFVALLGKE